ncbi:MAG TPA: HAD family phosphatase [Blastocatellia bacterium]|nr:HAD family phosphatase [Blastocatellia bacterium]
MLKAIIFDCDGVIADTEPIHMASLQRILGEEGITLTEEDYFRDYLALDDRACFVKAFSERGSALDQDQLEALIARKAEYVEPVMRDSLRLLPGVSEFIRRASELYPLAVASGALRREIELVLKYGDLTDCFRVIVSAEDVARSKPHPDPFLKARDLLDALSEEPLAPSECLVIEDSIHGVQAARQAAMKCLAVTNSYVRAQLQEADRVVESLADLSLEDVKRMFTA